MFYGGLIDICNTPYRIHGIADTPAEEFTSLDIHNSFHTHKSVPHRNVSDRGTNLHIGGHIPISNRK